MTSRSNSSVQWTASYSLPLPAGGVTVFVSGECDFTGTLSYAVSLQSSGGTAMVDFFPMLPISKCSVLSSHSTRNFVLTINHILRAHTPPGTPCSLYLVLRAQINRYSVLIHQELRAHIKYSLLKHCQLLYFHTPQVGDVQLSVPVAAKVFQYLAGGGSQEASGYRDWHWSWSNTTCSNKIYAGCAEAGVVLYSLRSLSCYP